MVVWGTPTERFAGRNPRPNIVGAPPNIAIACRRARQRAQVAAIRTVIRRAGGWVFASARAAAALRLP